MNARVAHLLRDLSDGAPIQSVQMQLTHAVIDGRAVNFCITRPRDIIQSQHLNGRFYEAAELADLARIFPRGGVFVDIGANIGNHTLWAALFMGAARVIAFEPNPKAVDLLVPNVMINGIGDVVDLSHLGLGLGAQASSGFGLERTPGNLGATKLEAGAGYLRVERADGLLRDQTPDMIKIDVEGMEMDVLSGLSGVLKRCRPALFVEVDTANADDFAAWCDANGYAVAKTYSRYEDNLNHLCVDATALSQAQTALENAA
ncbi:MAG: FkbM family methyltransferase [Pseudomonadota bacterium]